MATNLNDLIEAVRSFRDARDWKQFHTLRNLIASVSIEAGEMLELTQWKSDSEMLQFRDDPNEREKLEQESADVLMYLILISDAAGFNLLEAAKRKLDLNERRYPVEKSRGKATKHSHL